MAKVTITIEDLEDDLLGIGCVLDPPLTDPENMTTAQMAALLAMQTLGDVGEPEEMVVDGVKVNLPKPEIIL